ncbi:MAG TPA: tetratricopeptide repeat protein [Caulobacteraceae bacterium]|jgi:tetratricopeptide (TPR) repeat protein|nr:tetratricopeptide repeat protein [Caulobacteraceae bacterium]
MAGKGGIIEDILGGEEAERPERDVQAGLDPVAASLATGAARTDRTIAADLKAYLKRQARLVELQTEHLHEQRMVLLSSLRIRRTTDRLKLGMQLFFILVATALGLGAAVMVFDAFNSRSVVVETFDAPPALAARGLSGKVVAGGVLDALTRLQQATRSNKAARELSNAWTGDVKVEVPETGVSIGEIDRMLKTRFGHDIHIEGDLVQTDAGGVALTIRGDGVAPKTFEGGPGELDKLSTQAAEYVYGQSQPALYAVYLSDSGRDAEAIDFARTAYPGTDTAERPYLLNAWGNALENTGRSPREAMPLYSEAVRLKPDYLPGYANLMNTDLLLGDEEGAWRIGEATRRRSRGMPEGEAAHDLINADLVSWDLLPWRDALLADAKAHAGLGSNASDSTPDIAEVEARLHDLEGASLQLSTAQARFADPNVAAMTHFVRGRIAAEVGDTARSADEMEAFAAAYASPVVSSNYPGYLCWVAPAEEMAGRPAKADAVLAAAGRYVDCYRFRGDILDHRGDWAGAQRAYAAAVALAPDLPAAYYSWGLALARHGDAASAAEEFAAAHQRGPHWADPLKAWGDLLAREQRWPEAVAKYNEALKWAPAWIELKRARERALSAQRAG